MVRPSLKIQTFSSEKDFISANLAFIKGAKTIALSGGKTPIVTYQALKNYPATYFQVDERYTSNFSDESNQKMIRENLEQDFHHFDTSLSIDTALEKYEKEIADISFDVCILGIGNDGHIASIFPDSPNFTSPVAHTQTKEFPVHDRLTITIPKILESKKILVLAHNKSAILKKLQNGADLPAQKILNHPNIQIHHLVK